MNARISGRPFVKMSGSGNDFVFVDARDGSAEELTDAGRIAAICARGTGVGADGIVLLDRPDDADVRIRYYNADGSLAALCGNATLCTTRLAVEWGMAQPSGFRVRTGSGIVAARIETGQPEFDLAPVTDVRLEAGGIAPEKGERRIGFALVGVPHLVVECADVDAVDVVGRGAPLRRHPTLSEGANVNFVSQSGGKWRIRTFERGVENETLACGTGSVASAILLNYWGLAGPDVELETRSGKVLGIRLRREGPAWLASLRGEGRIVFQGQLGEV